MRGILGLHESKKVGMGILVYRFGDPGGVAIDREMIFYLLNDCAGEEQIFDIDTVFPGGATQDDGLILLEQIPADGA